MLLKKLILQPYETNNRVVNMQAKGLTHEDSLLQLPFRGNCLNWVVGHMIVSRDSVLRKVGQEEMWSKEAGARYDYDSEPLISAEDPGIIDFTKMLADLETGLERLKEGLKEMSEAQLNEANEKGQTLAEHLAFMGWHEGYHAGQTEYLRQLAGTDDKVI